MYSGLNIKCSTPPPQYPSSQKCEYVGVCDGGYNCDGGDTNTENMKDLSLFSSSDNGENIQQSYLCKIH